MLVHLKNLFPRAASLEQDIVIDETLMLSKGHLGWEQYMPKKRFPFGIKSYFLCKSNSEYVWLQIIYTGKGNLYDLKYKDLPQSIQVVMMSLVKPQLKADMLLKFQMGTFGTVKVNWRTGQKENC